MNGLRFYIESGKDRWIMKAVPSLSQRLRRFLEATDSDDGDAFDPFEIASVFADLEKARCRDWVERQIDMFARAEGSDKDRERFSGFVQGSVYGFVAAKSGDRELASRAGRAALYLALYRRDEVP